MSQTKVRNKNFVPQLEEVYSHHLTWEGAMPDCKQQREPLHAQCEGRPRPWEARVPSASQSQHLSFDPLCHVSMAFSQCFLKWEVGTQPILNGVPVLASVQPSPLPSTCTFEAGKSQPQSPGFLGNIDLQGWGCFVHGYNASKNLAVIT